jgi:hypothetical protein
MEDSKNIIIQAKNARIIAILADRFDGSIDKAMEVFYNSVTAQMIQDGYNNASEVIRAGLRMLVDLDPAAI